MPTFNSAEGVLGRASKKRTEEGKSVVCAENMKARKLVFRQEDGWCVCVRERACVSGYVHV